MGVEGGSGGSEGCEWRVGVVGREGGSEGWEGG